MYQNLKHSLMILMKHYYLMLLVLIRLMMIAYECSIII